MAVFFRPRNGNFVYDEIEQEIILEDIQTAIDLGIDTIVAGGLTNCLLYTSPSPRDRTRSRMPSSA